MPRSIGLEDAGVSFSALFLEVQFHEKNYNNRKLMKLFCVFSLQVRRA
jgi:hypothetical protein